MLTVLIVEDDLMIADILEEVLIDDGFAVSGICRTLTTALTSAACRPPDLAVVDVLLADGSFGTDVAAELVARYNTGILYTTAIDDALTGAIGQAALRKPFRIRDIRQALTIVNDLRMLRPIPEKLPDQMFLLAIAEGGDAAK